MYSVGFGLLSPRPTKIEPGLRRTTDHVYTKGSNEDELIGIWDSDKGKAANMNRTRTYHTPKWGLALVAVPPTITTADTPDSTPVEQTNMGPELDLDTGSITRPLTLQEQRANSYYLPQPQGAMKEQFRNSAYTGERRERLGAARARGDVVAAMAMDELGEMLMGSELTVVEEDEMIVHEDEPENAWPPPGAEGNFVY